MKKLLLSAILVGALSACSSAEKAAKDFEDSILDHKDEKRIEVANDLISAKGDRAPTVVVRSYQEPPSHQYGLLSANRRTVTPASVGDAGGSEATATAF